MDKEIIKLNADILRYKSVLYDENTSLPTLNIEFENLRRIITKNKNICCLYITIGRESMLEQIYGWESYDDVIKIFVKKVKECLSKIFKVIPIIAISSIKSDGIFVFFSEENTDEEISEKFVENVISTIQECLSRVEVKSEISNIWQKIVFYYGYKIFRFEPMMRIERIIYQATENAKLSAYFKEKKSEEELFDELKNLINKGDIYTYFQPIYDIEKYEIFGFEALTRGPKNSSFFEPDIIFSLASRYNIINDLEILCLSKALTNAKKIKKDKHLFFNITPNFIPTLFKGNLLKSFSNKLSDYRPIVFEITEKFVIYERNIYGELIDKLKKLNFEIALDDVGTGYSTLERIAEIKPKYLKYDKTLVKNLSKDLIRQELLISMLEFSNKIGSIMIIEGIENKNELEFLKKLGIKYGQGFFLGIPEEIQ